VVEAIETIDPAAPLQFIINAASGQHEPASIGPVIEEALRLSGRNGELLFAHPKQLLNIAQKAAARAFGRRSALVAVGGDGTVNTVAQAAHAQGCTLGVLPQGTFNYFARTHGIPVDALQALQTLLTCEPVPVQVGLINDHVFLVNSSLGLYPELLQDREAFKARFGRSRLVAFGSALVTMLGGVHRVLRLHIEHGVDSRDIRTTALFIGNNRLQLEQVGLAQASALDQGCLAAVILRPIGELAMLWLLLRGSFGTLGESDTVESFQFHRMVVRPRLGWDGFRVKVAFDGEVNWMRAPIEFKVSATPLYLIKPMTENGATGHAGGST
jgi:diacylglycerol kinase family enzyme